jgi:ABC-type transporter Mla subunit MlaD
MSDDQRATEIGKAVQDYADSSKRLDELKKNAKMIGATLVTLGGHLNRAAENTESYAGTLASQLVAHELPTLDSLKILVNELAQVSMRKTQLRQTLKNIGYEPKN